MPNSLAVIGCSETLVRLLTSVRKPKRVNDPDIDAFLKGLKGASLLDGLGLF